MDGNQPRISTQSGFIAHQTRIQNVLELCWLS